MNKSLTQEEVRALDSTRQQLLNLQTSLNALSQDLRSQPSLPSWSALQKHNGIIAAMLERLSDQLSKHHDLFSSLSVYPLPAFPGPSQSHILDSLLRSKLEPDVEEWVEKGEALAAALPTSSTKRLDDKDLHILWEWAPTAAQNKSWQQCWGGDYTLAERVQGLDPDQGWETIQTRLERELEDPGTPRDPTAQDEDGDGEVEEVEEDEMEGIEEQKQSSSSLPSKAQKATPMPLLSQLRYLSTGETS